MSYKTGLDVIEEDLNKWRAGKRFTSTDGFDAHSARTSALQYFSLRCFHNKAVFVVLGFMLAFLLFRLFTGKEDTPDTGGSNQSGIAVLQPNESGRVRKTVPHRK